MSVPRLVIAAPMSSSGKTTIITAIIAALTKRGLRVAPFKVGPDYIDPTYHTLAAGRACHNLDAWMLDEAQLRSLFARRTHDTDIALIEGVMGLFDGIAGNGDAGSTAHIARLLQAPVLLVLDASAMARTAAAIVKGLHDFDPRVKVASVLLNQVGGEAHVLMLREAIEPLGVSVVGYLKRDDRLHLPERHLGLIPTTERRRWQEWLSLACGMVEEMVNLNQVIALARNAPWLEPATPVISTMAAQAEPTRPIIAVARDDAFSFLYPDNLELLQAAGATLRFFSPLCDNRLPGDASAIYLCGGFPELYAAQLATNASLRNAIYTAAQIGMPIYAECGGLMYLAETLVDHEGNAHTMCGVLSSRSIMTTRMVLGYRLARAPRNNWLWRAGETIRGHEFHHSMWQSHDEVESAYEFLPTPYQPHSRQDGVQQGNVFASYLHVHFLAKPVLAERFVAAARAFRESHKS